MSFCRWSALFGCVLLLLLFASPTASAQQASASADGWWAPVADRSLSQVAASKTQYDRGSRRPGRGGPAHRGRSGRRASHNRLHVPKGHLPPPGQCRLWVPGRPPGQQPPPTTCRTAVRHRRGPAVVVTHRGPVSQRPSPRWRHRPAGDLVFHRPPRPAPRREEGVTLSVEILIDLLGRSGYRSLTEQKRRLDLEGALTGRWIPGDDSGTTVLQVRAGRQPLAELVDRTGDGRVDAFYVQRK